MKRLTRIALATFVVLGLGAGTALADHDYDDGPRQAPPAQRYQQVDHRDGHVFVQGRWDCQSNQWDRDHRGRGRGRW